MIELLAPVGSKESLIAAVESGANAIYLAGKMFGARAYAANFENEELEEAIQFAHMRGVLVDVAVNTIVDNSEFEELADYLRFLYKSGADAIIVQDLGVAKLAKEIVPNLILHASTQMTVHNIEGVKMLSDLGFKRVVLSRELSMEDIKYICENVAVEIEVFIHGALCICYSGQCLMSGMIGGRSGNRGRCAQPCRLPYTLVDKDNNDLLKDIDSGEYLLSPKDLNTIELIPEFIDAGVTSLKIEGRMKRPEYVAVVVDTYRRAIDSYLASKDDFFISQQDHKNLAQIFNRDFTTAYMKTRPGRFMMSDRRPNNRGVLVGRVVRYDAQIKLVTIKLIEDLYVNDIIEFWVKVGGRVSSTINKMTVNGKVVEHAEPNQEVTFAILAPVRDNDRVFKVFDANMMERARSFFHAGAPIRRIPVDIEVSASIGQPLTIEMQDADGFYGQAQTNFIAEKALKRPLTIETVQKQIERLGTTVFEVRNFKCNIQDEIMVPMSEMNEARRVAVEMLERARLATFNRPALEARDYKNLRNRLRLNHQQQSTKPKLVVNVDSLDKVDAAIENGADIIMFGGENFSHKPISIEHYKEAYQMVKNNHKKIIFNTPRLLKRWQMESFRKLLTSFKELEIDEISASNIATIDIVRQIVDVPIHADSYLNVYNTISMETLAELGVKSVTLSPELNFGQIEKIVSLGTLETECIAHGNLSLMVSEYCMMGSYLGNLDKGKCSQPCTNNQYWLLDRKEEKFPLVTDQFCRMHLLNGKELSMFPHVARFAQIGVDRIRIEGKYYTKDRIAKLTKLYREFLDLGENHPLILQDKISSIENDNITRGHYFRGVL
ncbi:MAG: peptidase [Firmicutes bacterium]|nr:peptidase [Bacillota bacterium]